MKCKIEDNLNKFDVQMGLVEKIECPLLMKEEVMIVLK